VASPRRTLTALALVCVAAAGGVVGARWAVQELRDPVCAVSAVDRTEQFTPEQTANASTISMVSVQRGLSPRAASIALATAIQESKLRNISYGDADSLGLFQQRPSQGWGTEEEVTDPVHAAGEFYDRLVQIEGWQDAVITEVAQKVQRSAFPEAYADHEWEGRVLASVLTGETPAGLTCQLDAPSEVGDASATADKAARQLGSSAQVDGDRLTFTAADRSQAWAVASWAVAHAEAEQIVSVRVDGRAWDRETEPMTWAADAGAPDATTVEVQVAS
jgi:hypothetical protein